MTYRMSGLPERRSRCWTGQSMMLGPERLTYGTDVVTNELARRVPLSVRKHVKAVM